MRDLSVVVSAPGSCASVERCLRALAAQTLPPERFEVVVALHGPGDAARDAVDRALAGPLAGHEVVLLDAVAPSSVAARNAAVAAARGRWATPVDGRDTLTPDLLTALLDAASDERVVAARVEPEPDPLTDVAVHRARGGWLVPTAWLRAVPWPEGGHLAEHADAVRAARLLSRFEHRFTTVDRAPALAGAAYLLADELPHAQLPRPTVAERVEHGVAALQALTAGTQAHPADRSPVTDVLVESVLGDLRRHASEDPDAADLVERLLREAQVPGVAGPGSGAPSDGTWSLFHEPPTAPRAVTVIASGAGALNARARLLGFLTRAGVSVRLVHYSGRLTPALRRLPGTHRVAVLPATSDRLEARLAVARSRRRRVALRVAGEALRVGRRVVPEVLPPSVTAPAWRRLDRRPAPTGPVVVLDRRGAVLLRGVEHDAPLDLHDLCALTLRVAASRLGGHLQDAHAARDASRRLRRDPVRTRSTLDERLWAMVAYRLLRSNRLEAAAQVLDDLTAVFGRDAATRHGVPALLALLAVQTGAPSTEAPPPSTDALVAAVRATLEEADDLGPDELDGSAFLATVALDVLFTRRLHAAVVSTPLVDAPETFLAPLRDTATGRRLAAPAAWRRDGTDATAEPATGRVGMPRVVVVPGAYPKFARAVVEQLSPVADVEVLDLSARDQRFANTGVDPRTVRDRLWAATSGPAPVTTDALSADVVFVDWADKGLTWVTDTVPEGTRVVVRLHGVDTLSAWLHTADWSRVTDAVFPSEHLRLAAAAALGGRLDGVRQHVVANPVDVERYALPKHPSARYRLGMVGWAQQVKDPLWALDVLAELRRHDDRWRLALIGADVDLRATNPVEREHAEAFHARLAADPALHGAIDYVGYTSRLPERLRDVGWAVSASRREGFHIGLVEMAASGAVPVVRDWPVYARHEGAKRLFPADWVVTTPADAAARVLALADEHADEDAWRAASAATLEATRHRFSGHDAGSALREIVLRTD